MSVEHTKKRQTSFNKNRQNNLKKKTPNSNNSCTMQGKGKQ
jgi:hypothetical protein